MDVSEQEGDDTEDDDGDREPGFERDSDTEDMEASGEEGDRLSEMSDSFNSSLLYRSRIPVPIAGSFGKHMVSILNFRPLIYCAFNIFQKVVFCLMLYTKEVNLLTFIMI